jgi:hypothetical protein
MPKLPLTPQNVDVNPLPSIDQVTTVADVNPPPRIDQVTTVADVNPPPRERGTPPRGG